MKDANIGKLARGCELCKEGKKSVLFVTGICPRKCDYCPLSDEKMNRDVIHINEVHFSEGDIDKFLNELEESNSKGIGITGGDPLARIDRTCLLIKEAKKKFGKKFHTHLYTSLDLIDEKMIAKLQEVGLDELRIHPDVFDQKLWSKLDLISGKFKEVGIEIPAFPSKEKEIIELIDYAKDKVDLFNLNELEYATKYEKEYAKKNWKVSEDYSVKGSEKTALEILKLVKKKFPKVRIHYCSAEFKDKVQLSERIKARAKKAAKKFDKITYEGMLVRGVVYSEGFVNDKDILKVSDEERKKIIPKLNKLVENLRKEFKGKEFILDEKKLRIIFDARIAEKVAKKFNLVGIVEEYPTADQTEVDFMRIN